MLLAKLGPILIKKLLNFFGSSNDSTTTTFFEIALNQTT